MDKHQKKGDSESSGSKIVPKKLMYVTSGIIACVFTMIYFRKSRKVEKRKKNFFQLKKS